MKTFMTSLIATLALAASASALLPPLYESLAEYKALLNDKKFEESLGSGEAIEEIERTSRGFIITTPKKTLIVDVLYKQTGKIGPADFELKFYPTQPRDDGDEEEE